MPYKKLFESPPSCVKRYIGLDLRNRPDGMPDLQWDGKTIPLDTDSIDCAIATEVLEHCPYPDTVMQEICRVLKPNGVFFFSVPFLWPLHEVPRDEYRYTPWSLERLSLASGFSRVKITALGGWDASLAQMLALWVARRPMSNRKRLLVTAVARPIVRYLQQRDHPVGEFLEGQMITGLTGLAFK
jgi:SAM-dependent methyltransferase